MLIATYWGARSTILVGAVADLLVLLAVLGYLVRVDGWRIRYRRAESPRLQVVRPVPAPLPEVTR